MGHLDLLAMFWLLSDQIDIKHSKSITITLNYSPTLTPFPAGQAHLDLTNIALCPDQRF